MDEQQNNNTEPIEITKARSRVTTNTPAFLANPPHFPHFLFLNSRTFSGVVRMTSKPDSSSVFEKLRISTKTQWKGFAFPL
jgi:hypothetical protein